MTVMQSRKSLRMMTWKNRCCRTVEEETSHRVCKTRGLLGTNARNGVANSVQARDAAVMLVVDEEDPERLTMTSADDEDDERGDAVTRRGDKGVARYRCSGENSTGGEATLRRAPLSVPTTNEGGPRTTAMYPEGMTQR
uniref:Uncharacterized protein n=1 Tax=Oryza barthii TaxID=65489 RepID=A0A0D3FU40_9ORYZ